MWTSCRHLVVATIVLVAVSCARSDGRVRSPVAPCPSAAETESSPRVEISPPRDLDQLVAAVQELPATLDDPSHDAVVDVLENLADTIELIPEVGRDAATRIDALAEALDDSTSKDPKARIVADALGEALRVVAHFFGEEPSAPAQAAYLSAVDAVGRLRGDDPLRGQKVEISRALAAITGALQVGYGQQSSFEGLEPLPRGPEAFRDRTAVASDRVTEIASARGHDATRLAIVRALGALGDAAAAAPAPRETRTTLDAHVLSIRYGVAHLTSEGSDGFTRNHAVKTSLVATVEALAVIVRETATAPAIAQEFVSRARIAAAAIDGDGLLAFQHVSLQEALRSIVDGYLLVAGATVTPAAR